MGAVALVAMLAGGPLGMCLALAYGAVTILKIAKVDAQFAAKGELPPSAKLVDKWLDGRKAAGKAPKSAKVKPYGSRAYAKQRWLAMWEDLGETHREVRGRYKAAVADAKAKGVAPPPKPTFEETLSGWKWHLDQPAVPAAGGRPVQAAPAAAGRPAAGGGRMAEDPRNVAGLYPGTPPPAAPPAPANTTAPAPANAPAAEPTRPKTVIVGWGTEQNTLWWHCTLCGHKQGYYNSEDAMVSDQLTHVKERHGDDKVGVNGWYGTTWSWQCHNCGTVETATSSTDLGSLIATHDCPPKTPVDGEDTPPGRYPWTCETCSAVSYDTQPQPQGTVIRCYQCPTEGDTMTAPAQQSGEVTGIPSAIHYLRRLAAVHTEVGGNEALTARMAAMNIGPADIAKVQAAMQASIKAADQFTVAADTIDLHNAGVRQGYAASPDAADKHAQMAE